MNVSNNGCWPFFLCCYSKPPTPYLEPAPNRDPTGLSSPNGQSELEEHGPNSEATPLQEAELPNPNAQTELNPDPVANDRSLVKHRAQSFAYPWLNPKIPPGRSISPLSAAVYDAVSKSDILPSRRNSLMDGSFSAVGSLSVSSMTEDPRTRFSSAKATGFKPSLSQITIQEERERERIPGMPFLAEEYNV